MKMDQMEKNPMFLEIREIVFFFFLIVISPVENCVDVISSFCHM